MSGTRRTIAIRLSTEGADEARAKLEQVGTTGAAALGRVSDAAARTAPAMAQVGDAADKIAASTFRAQAALASLGSAVPALAPITAAMGELAGGLGVASRAAVAAEASFGGVVASLGRMAVPLAAVGGAALGMFTNIRSAGEAATTTQAAMDGWRSSLENLLPSLDRAAEGALRLANESRRAALAAREIGFGRVIERQGSIVGEISTADAAERSAADRVNAARERRGRFTGAGVPELATVEAALDSDITDAERRLGRVRENRSRLVEEYRLLGREEAEFVAERARLGIPLTSLEQQGPSRPSGGAGGGGSTRDQGYGPATEAEHAAFIRANVQAEQAAIRAAEQASEARRREAAQELERSQRQFDAWVNRVGDGLANDIARGLIDGGQRGAPTLSQILTVSLRASVARGVAEGVSSAVIQPGIRAVTGAASSVFSPSAEDGSGTGQLSNILGLGRSASGQFGGGAGVSGFVDGLGTSYLPSVFGTAGPAAYSALPAGVSGPVLTGNAAGAAGLSGVLGAAGAGFGAGQVVNGLAGGNSTNGMIGSAVGTAAGIGLALAFPAIGVPLMLASILGGAAGGGIGGMFGGKDKAAFSGGAVEYAIGGDGQLFSTKDGFKGYPDADKARADADATLSRTNQAVRGAGLRLVSGGQGGTIGYGTDATTGRDQADFANVVRSALRSDNANISSVIGNGKFSTDDIFQAADFINKIYEPLLKTDEAAASFSRAIDAINGPMSEAIALATRFGLETQGLADKQAEAIAKLIAARQAQLTAADTGYTVRGLRATGRGAEADSVAFEAAATLEITSLRASLTDLGMTAAESAGLILKAETTIGQERLALAEKQGQVTLQAQQAGLQAQLTALQRIQQQAGILSSFLDAQAVGGAGVSPQQSFLAAQGQFGDAVAAARGGGDLSAVTSAASQLLSANNAFNATGVEGGAVRSGVLSTVRNLGASLDLPGFGGSLEAAMARYTKPNTDALASLTTEIADLRNELRGQRLRAA